ncbi:NACHT domain-containing protein [Actinomadura flavalba]|uniref:NACHT N-terminal Helical domain 1-containing protein n=1 Tax=Actinomadura flavalba TaxID=1120938 RepID=UPI00036E8959|nr:NACHT domain-containing protein [Actinomadura flavalba]
MDPVAFKVASPAAGQLIKALFFKEPVPGAGLVDKPVRLAGWVKWRGGKKELAEKEIRKLVRQLERDVTDEDPALRMIGVPEGEAVGRAVTAALLAFDRLAMDDVQNAGLDPTRLMETLLDTAGDTGRDALTEPGRTAHDRVLALACLHVLEFFTRRPEFSARTAVDHTHRLEALHAAVEELNRKADKDESFRAEYLDAVATQVDQLRLFGLQLPVTEQSYAMSTAYVTLSVHADKRPGEADRHRASAEFEDLLRDSDRVVLEGPAGAGKTTLLQRLVLHICRGDLPSGLSDWQTRVPFLLRLREFVRSNELSLPSVEKFVGLTTPLLDATQQPGWTLRMLRRGRAVVLLDGVDEVPQAHRQHVLRWLTDLTRMFPTAKFVVTSRPRVIGDEWHAVLERDGFARARLEPMTRDQVHDFVDRWHATVLPDREDDRDRLAASLRDALVARRDLARLATNPLLCAMLCALNRNNNAYLPHGRTALYEDALTMLLERRDRERRMEAAPIHLSRSQAQLFLAALAEWMMLNGQRVMDRKTALDRIGDLTPLLRGVDSVAPEDLPETVFTHLTQRSGLLQLPAMDQLEFCHPSFQDYLAAGEVIRKNNISHVLRRAHDPLYHDVIIMSVAQAQNDPGRQRELLSGLIEQAEAGGEDARRLWLLAAACVADVDVVDPEIAGRVHAETASLLPPRGRDEIGAVTACGPFVLDLLADAARRPGLTHGQVEGIVRVAGAFGDESALALIRRFCEYPVRRVQRALTDAWEQAQDPERYTREILAHSKVTAITVRQPHLVPLLRQVPELTEVDVWCQPSSVSRESWETLRGITVERFGMRVPSSIDWSMLTEWAGLRRLTLDGDGGIDWRCLATLRGLNSLVLRDIQDVDWEALASLPHLVSLQVIFPPDSPGRVKLAPLTRRNGLTSLALRRFDAASFPGHELARLTELQDLRLENVETIDLTPVATLPKLHALGLMAAGVRDVTPLGALRDLRYLNLSSNPITDLRPLRGFPSEGYVNVTHTEVADLSPIRHISLITDPNGRRIYGRQ